MTPSPRRLRAAVTAAVPAAALAAAVLVPAGPAGAVAPAAIPASCTALDLDDAPAVAANAEGTDDVFHGIVRKVVTVRTTADSTAGTAGPTATATNAPAARTLRVTVDVENVLTGDLTAGRTVTVVVTGTDDQRPPRGNQQYLFFTTGANDALRAADCNGYVATPNLDAATLDLLRDALAPEDDAGVVLTRPSDASDDPPGLGRVVAPGAAISLVGLLGLVLLAFSGRQRPTG